jgi:hypothetical protein
MNRERMRDPQEISKIMEQALFELEIVGKEESGRYRLAVTNNEGIKVKIGRSKENLMIMVYELQVPLRKTTQYQHAIEVAEDPYVGLGVEIGYMMKPSERKPGEKLEGRDRNGPPPGAGMENDGGGPPGGGRRPQGRPMARGEKTEPEEMWWRVRLTSPDQP